MLAHGCYEKVRNLISASLPVDLSKRRAILLALSVAVPSLRR
jgi:hypothetical protein